MISIVPLIGLSAFETFSYGLPLVLYGFRMVSIVPIVGLSVFGFVFEWFSYAVVNFSYGFNRPHH